MVYSVNDDWQIKVYKITIHYQGDKYTIRKDDIPMKNLKKLREARGMSQQKLADELFVTQQGIYKYENDLAFPNLETLKMMSRLFQTSIDFIVENDFSENSSLNHSEILANDEKILLNHYRKLSPKKKASILTVLKCMK